MAGNTGKVKLIFNDVYSNLLKDEIRLEFYNRNERGLDFQHTAHLQGVEHTLEGVPAFPTGAWEVHILPKKYRHKKVLVNLPANGEVILKESFFIDPGSVKPVFPEKLETDSGWSRLWKAIPYRTPTGICFARLDDQQKAGLLNLYAKMKDNKVHNVFDSVMSVVEVKPARIYAIVKPSLYDEVKAHPDVFDPEPGTLHSRAGWMQSESDSSFKTSDPTGNLQLTFFVRGEGEYLIDADLDDHRGVKHAFDVVKHKVSSGDTHPYDIHQILAMFQGIDPGYYFS
jgi:hypothetical protein